MEGDWVGRDEVVATRLEACGSGGVLTGRAKADCCRVVFVVCMVPRR